MYGKHRKVYPNRTQPRESPEARLVREALADLREFRERTEREGTDATRQPQSLPTATLREADRQTVRDLQARGLDIQTMR